MQAKCRCNLQVEAQPSTSYGGWATPKGHIMSLLTAIIIGLAALALLAIDQKVNPK